MKPSRPPAANVRHFSINADDLARARKFYSGVFGWGFDAWGPPGFFMIKTGDAAAPRGSLQGRRELIPGERITTFECTIAVDDVDAVEKAIIANGGTILMPKATIPTVGQLIWFRDTEGNVAGAMQYDPAAEVGD